MKKMLASLLVLAMILSLSMGCISASAEQGEVKDVTLSLVSYLALQTEPCAWYETEVWTHILKRIEEQYGWRITFDYDNYSEDKLNLMYASGELPDILYFYSANQAQIILENDYALNLKPLLEEYAPNINSEKYAHRNEIMSNLAGGEDHGLYFIPMRMGVEMDKGGKNSSRGYTLRWDWYKEIGAPEFTDDASFIDVLAQMVANHPTTEDGLPVYAYGYRDDFSTWTQWRAAFTNESLVNPWTFSGYLYSEGLDDNVLYNGYTNVDRSTYWQEMRFANKLYNMGLLDPDSFTQGDPEYSAKLRAGQYAAAIMWDDRLRAEEVKKDPNTTAGFIVVPSTGEMHFANKIHIAGYYPDQQVCISSQSENWEAALAFFDYMHTDEACRTLESGIEGVHWNYVDGVPTLTEETIAMQIAGGDPWAMTGINSDSPIAAVQVGDLHQDGYPMYLFDTDAMRAASMNSLEKDFSEYYGVAYPSLARQKLVDEGLIINHSHNFSQTTALAREPIPTDILRILTRINDIMYRAIPNLVTAQTEEAFAAAQADVLQQLADADEATAWEWAQQAQAAAHEKVDPVLREAGLID